ncbi:MAG: YbjN domain-containing protein [Deltaproteobacteria bacterium]|nr:YbjN domain-containing protein [Deltaproteobacteria bacterium]
MGRILDACRDFLEGDDWPYREHPERDVLSTRFQGKNGEFGCGFQERAEQEQVVFYSFCPTLTPEDRCLAVSEFLTRANCGMIVGNFEMDWSNGAIRYKTSADVQGVDLADVFLRNLVYANILTMDRYLPGLLEVISGEVDAEQAIREIEE